MRIVTIDCGTTNSRVYVVDEKGFVYGKASRKVGVRDTAISGSRHELQVGLKLTLEEAINSAGVQLDDIDFIISSGMITSELGLKELPHLWAPVSIDTLAKSIERVEDPEVFPQDIPVYFVRGIKNKYDPSHVDFIDVGKLDFMRGEEAQIAGIVSLGIAEPPFTVAMLSSHTKYISVDSSGRIMGSVTTLSGQIFDALLSNSFIGKSIQSDPKVSATEGIDQQVLDSAFEWVQKTGLLRSLLMTRFLDVLMETEWYQRRLFVEGCIAAEDIKALTQFKPLGLEINTPYVLIGKHARCAIYKDLISRKTEVNHDIQIISEESLMDSLSIHGALLLGKKAGLIKKESDRYV